jgi:tetratricopeptide (TPR) repeat protein
MKILRLSVLGCCVVVCLVCSALCRLPQTSADPAYQEEFEKGKAALVAHKYDNAIASFKKANKLHQNQSADCYYGIALVLQRQGEVDRALENATKALALAGDDISRAVIHNLKGSLFLGIGRNEPKKLKNAEDEYRAATQLDKNNPDYHLNLARALLLQSKDVDAKPELQACLDCKPDASTAREAKLMLADPRKGREEIAPDFQFKTLQGNDLSLSGVAGKVLVMDFWATWCPPCRESVPELKALTRKYPADKLVLVSVSADSDENAWRDFIAKKNMDWAQYRDTDHKVLEAFQIHAFPTYLVITGDGIVKQRIVGLNPQQSVVYRLRDTLGSMHELEGVSPK